MVLVTSVALLLLFLGFPFYWGAFGHPSVALPIIWALAVALALNARHWRHFGAGMGSAVLVTSVMSVMASAAAFAVGHVLSR